jgi:hypothetical protein
VVLDDVILHDVVPHDAILHGAQALPRLISPECSEVSHF